MRPTIYLGITLLALSAVVFCDTNVGSTALQTSQQSQDKTMNCNGMNERGDQAMGFSHMKATHHFRLLSGGGAIEVEANNGQDKETREQIRMHLSHIAQMFARGNFDAPMFIHDQTPPGVPVMQRLKSEIKYEFEKTERGGRVRMTTSSAEALEAIHEFLSFQIKEHETGDSVEVK
jgi:hypothetical protein